jgi:hypothetical protein
MARCQGTTQSGEQCKREAQEGSRFCYAHQPEEEEYQEDRREELELEDFVPILLAGAATLAFVLAFKSLGRLIPKL